MTEQEAQAIAVRLTRVWMPMPPVHTLQQRPSYSTRSTIEYLGEVAPGVEILIMICMERPYYAELTWQNCQLEFIHGELDYNYFRPCPPQDWDVVLPQFIAQWMDFFRRGCWLSGCDIETSAHEKAEWIQGFSREEIEVWNLKM